MTKQRTDGEGSIYQRHGPTCPPALDGRRPKHKCNGKWIGTLVTHYIEGADGIKRPVRKKVSANTKTGAAVKLNELSDRIKGADLPADGKAITVEAWMTYWYKKIAANKVKPLTLAGYDAKVNQYIIPLLGHHKLDRLTPEHIDDAWTYLRDTGNPTSSTPTPLAANTIHQTHRILSRALKVAVQRKKLRTNPAGSDSMDAPARTEHDIKPMTSDEVDAVMAAARGTWNAARWSVALAVGLRQGEALGLRWEDVDLDAGTISIRQTLMRLKGQGIVFGTPKSAKSRRTFPVPSSLLAALKAHRIEQNAKRLEVGSHWTDSGLVFTLEDGRPLDPSVDAGRWRKLLQAAGVKHYRLHDARHSAATMMVSQDVDLRVAMNVLGHSQLSVTMRYQHAVDEVLIDAAKKMDQAGRWA